ncbi:stress-activated map kinase interacting protein 1-domain-containing protein [Radiomyces spectabilis]|uniref:stress-activated map kinase interacting protein 1-domain-containing protein n=1 Tax=Radiomyces spectabilis TaxID=64574 RepID=UPI00221FAD1B|nr:stress-activated map kinase interacting protein 1-domain-containing protein [Radiomyces spectabilis]KAI8371491.1 stress-activated map kinase interacting protein 1-domain-containing protein [Radiomyces spectabilis]
MALTTDADFLIHMMRIKFLRMDERGERIISFHPTVMSDDYIRLAAPTYPEMQYCYSPVYESLATKDVSTAPFGTGLVSSPRTKRSHYRLRRKDTDTSIPPLTTTQPTPSSEQPKSLADRPSISDDDYVETDESNMAQGGGIGNDQTAFRKSRLSDADLQPRLDSALTSISHATSRGALDSQTDSFHGNGSDHAAMHTSLHPSVDSAIDPSPRSSLDIIDPKQGSYPFPHAASATTRLSVDDIRKIPTLPAPVETVHPTVPSQSRPPPASVFSPLRITKIDLSQPATVPSTSSSSSSSSSPPSALSPRQLKKPAFGKSVLSALIAEKASVAENPFAEFSFVSGKGEPNSITLCVYLPHSDRPYEPVSLVVRPDAIIYDVIGYILYDYVEQKRKPELDPELYDLSHWVLLIAEDDGEIEDDLPALDRTRKIDRVSFDQFALCRANASQVKQNEQIRAKLGRSKPSTDTIQKDKSAATLQPTSSMNLAVPSNAPSTSISPTTSHADNTSMDFLDPLETSPYAQPNQEADSSAVAVPVPSSKAMLTKATMPMTPLKYFRIRLMTNEEVSATTTIPVYAEMFIGDVLDMVSRKRKLDPDEYMLMIADSNVIIPNDTTVESLRGITELTFTKKNTALTIPSSSHIWRSPIKKKKDDLSHPMYFASDGVNASSGPNANDGIFSQYKKYTVNRKMPMFVGRRVSVLAIDGDYIHLMPPEHKGMFDSVKTTSFHVSAVRTCKQSKKVPSNFKIVIMKERDYKTYDLEAENAKEAYEICARIRFLMQVSKGA